MVRILFPPAKTAANPESLDQAVLISGGPQLKRRRVPAPGPGQGDGQANPFRPWHHANKPGLKHAPRDPNLLPTCIRL